MSSQAEKKEEKEDKVENYRERTCAKCQKTGVNLSRCSRCKDTFYCSRDCQKEDWSSHKVKCVPPSQRPKPVDEEIVAGTRYKMAELFSLLFVNRRFRDFV